MGSNFPALSIALSSPWMYNRTEKRDPPSPAPPAPKPRFLEASRRAGRPNRCASWSARLAPCGPGLGHTGPVVPREAGAGRARRGGGDRGPGCAGAHLSLREGGQRGAQKRPEGSSGSSEVSPCSPARAAVGIPEGSGGFRSEHTLRQPREERRPYCARFRGEGSGCPGVPPRGGGAGPAPLTSSPDPGAKGSVGNCNRPGEQPPPQAPQEWASAQGRAQFSWRWRRRGITLGYRLLRSSSSAPPLSSASGLCVPLMASRCVPLLFLRFS